MGYNEAVASIEMAHESSVFALDWHPLGHILVSGSNDHTTRFWTRNRPGDSLQDRFNMTREAAEAIGLKTDDLDMASTDFGDANKSLPGLGVGSVPGLGGYNDDEGQSTRKSRLNR